MCSYACCVWYIYCYCDSNCESKFIFKTFYVHTYMYVLLYSKYIAHMDLHVPQYTNLYFLQIWLCEFCGTQNEVDIVPEEIPY